MLIKQDFLYTPNGTNRPLHIYLPEDYFSSREHYPVMYFFDGHNLYQDCDATYGKCWGLKDFLDGWGKKMIVVGMECSHEGNERLSEYLPYPADKGCLFEPIVPMGESTFRWLLHEVKPYIDSHYRTIPFRECTGIGGSSMGGIMAIYGAVHCNRWFSKAACVSSAIGCCMASLTADMDSHPISPDTRMFLSWGTKEAWGLEDTDQEDRTSASYHWNKQVADCAAAQGAAVQLYCQVGGGHCEADWEKQVPMFMDFLWMH